MIEGFKHVSSNDKRDFIEAEVGDFKVQKFMPQVKIKRFDNEFNFSARYKHDGNGEETYELKDGKIVWRQGINEAHFYNITNGYEFEVILNEKPESNIVEFTIQTKGIDFFYQGELTEEEKSMGFERPENVIGSYALYMKTKKRTVSGGKKYGTGKIGHIYRPKIVDARGDWVWGDMLIDENSGILSVTIPEEFLGKAQYPVVVDPTFGYDTAGGSNVVVGSASEAVGSLYNTLLALDGDTVTGISFYAKKNSGNETVETGIYTVSGGELATKVGSSGSVTVNSTTEQWWDTSVSIALSDGVEYGVAYGGWGGASGSENTKIYYDSGAPAGTGSYATTTTLPASWSEVANFSLYFSIYATYTREPITIDYSYSIFIDKGKL